MDTKLVPIESLSLDPSNVRKHNDKNIAAIKASLKRFGQQKPIVVDGNLIVRAGNGTLQAAQELGWDEISVIQSGLAPSELTAFAIADNRTAELAEWDMDGLAKQLAALDEEGISYDELGFEFPDDDERSGGNEGLTDPDEVPEVTESVVKRGEIWKLGKHRLMCGDSTSKDDVDRLMAGEKADMCFTSPPYNGNTHLDYGKRGGNHLLYKDNKTDNKTSSEYLDFAQQALGLVLEYTDGFCFWNVMYNNKSRWELFEVVRPYIGNLHETIIWLKKGMPISSGLTRDFEFIFCFRSGEAKKKHLGETFKTESNVWQVSNQNSQTTTHKACFPVSLPMRGIELASSKGGVVVEPFCGSGTTLIACEKTNRRCYGCEIDAHYCSVVIQRWKDFTGKEAYRINDDGTETSYSQLSSLQK